jgi:regulator of protease activity HflC (stomatin/prohibitin superfamily)
VFPTTWQIIDFSPDIDPGDVPLSASTSDGQAVTIEATVYFRLKYQEVYQLYEELGSNYYDNMLSVAKATLKNTASTFSTNDFFINRTAIARTMHSNLDAIFSAQKHARVQTVLLRGISFPPAVETAVVNKMISDQQTSSQRYLNQVQQIQADTSVLIAKANQNITETLSVANAQATYLLQSATANATKMLVDAQSQAWNLYRSTLNLTNDQLLRVQWARQVKLASNNVSYYVGFESLNGGVNILI